jgi:hypothetical protein
VSLFDKVVYIVPRSRSFVYNLKDHWASVSQAYRPRLLIPVFDFHYYKVPLEVEIEDDFSVGLVLRLLPLARYILLQNRTIDIYTLLQFPRPVWIVDHPTILILDGCNDLSRHDHIRMFWFRLSAWSFDEYIPKISRF